jgi:hypothetical protein
VLTAGQEGRVFFFEKKKQKTFPHSGQHSVQGGQVREVRKA